LSTRLDALENKNYLIFLLVVVVFLIANEIHQENFSISDHPYMINSLPIISSFIVAIFGVLLSFKYKARGSNGIAWILFTLATSCWFIAEYTYTYDYDIENISTFTSDIFYIASYPLFLGFTIFYFKPRKILSLKNAFSIFTFIFTSYYS
jgi:hypothetical protein